MGLRLKKSKPTLTNILGLPQPLVDAVANDSYDRGEADISVTGLLKPPRQAALQEQHADEIVEDASDRIWSLMGQIVHGILERANRIGIAERRLSIEVEGWRVSGGMDAYFEGGLLQDYKTVSVWKFKDGTVPEEYEQQLNCYAELLRGAGIPVNQLQVVAILRDWSKLEALRNQAYPRHQTMVLDVPMWPAERAQKFLRERVILHQQARVKLPECSAADRWEKPAVWAVMKKGRKSAVKLYDSEADAQAHAALDSSLSVVHRPGESVRCLSYCNVAEFCEQFRKAKEDQS